MSEGRPNAVPLPERLRPRALDEVVGQAHLLGPGKLLRTAADRGELPSLILWGPPGCGKTTLARLLAECCDLQFLPYSAVSAGVKEVREAIVAAEDARKALLPQESVLFLDEIHRFSRTQQDVLLPKVEDGTLRLLGATTENPSFAVTSALLSRCRVVVLEALSDEELNVLVDRGLALLSEDAERPIRCDEEARAELPRLGGGDGRATLHLLEIAAGLAETREPATITAADVRLAVGRPMLRHGTEEHYDLLSAFHKSLRGSDPDAAVYWIARMLDAGEDPRVIARRMIRFASEDVGNADPQALPLAQSAWSTVERLGLPEGDAALAQVAAYLACAPKSDASYRALNQARQAVKSRGQLAVPLRIRNAPTELMKSMGYGKGYRSPHGSPDGFLPDSYLPEELERSRFYEPEEIGFEREMRKRLEWWRQRRAEAAAKQREKGQGAS